MDNEIKRLLSILKDVKPENCLWINNGPIVRNIYELVIALKSIDDKTFAYHINKDKNDVSTWIKVMLDDNELAEDLLKTTNREKTIKKIKKRVSYIEKESDKARSKKAVETEQVIEKELGKGKREKVGITKGAIEKEFSIERMFLELIISFILGIIVGIVIGILIEYYAIIPRGWF